MKLILKALAWPVTLMISALVWICAVVFSRAASLFALTSALIFALALAVLLSGAPQNAPILAVAAFLVSPVGLPMLMAKLLGGLVSVNNAIKDFIYG